MISRDVYKSGGGHTEQELPHVGVFFGGGSKFSDVHRDSTSWKRFVVLKISTGDNCFGDGGKKDWSFYDL